MDVRLGVESGLFSSDIEALEAGVSVRGSASIAIAMELFTMEVSRRCTVLYNFEMDGTASSGGL